MLGRTLLAVHLLLLYSGQMNSDQIRGAAAVNLSQTNMIASTIDLSNTVQLQEKTQEKEKSQVKVETKVEAKSQAKTEAKSESKAQVKTEAKTEIKSEAQAKQKVEQKAEVSQKSEAKAQSKAQTKQKSKSSSKAGVDEELADFNIMTPNPEEQDHQLLDVNVDQQTLMAAAQEALSKQQGKNKVSQDDLMALVQKLQGNKPIDTSAAANANTKLPSGETQAQRDAARAMILQSLQALGGVDGPLPAALGGGELPGKQSVAQVTTESTASTGSGSDAESKMKDELSKADDQSNEDDKALAEQIEKDKQNIQTLQKRLDNAINIYKDHTKLLDKKKELMQKMKDLSNQAREESRLEKQKKDKSKNFAQNKSKAQEDLMKASSEAQKVMETIENDVKNSQSLMEEEFKENKVISQEEKNKIVEKAVEDAKKEVESKYKDKLNLVEQQHKKEEEEQNKKHEAEKKKIEKKHIKVEKKLKKENKKQKMAQEKQMKESEAAMSQQQQSPSAEEKEQDAIIQAAAERVANAEDAIAPKHTESAAPVETPKQKAPAKKHSKKSHVQNKKPSDNEDRVDEAFGAEEKQDGGDIYFDKEFKSEELQDAMNSYQEEENVAFKEPLRASDMEKMEQSGKSLYQEITSGMSNPVGRGQFWKDKEFFRKHNGY